MRRRLLRILLVGITALSTIMCIVTVSLWTLTYHAPRGYRYIGRERLFDRTPHRVATAASFSGCWQIEYREARFTGDATSRAQRYRWWQAKQEHGWNINTPGRSWDNLPVDRPGDLWAAPDPSVFSSHWGVGDAGVHSGTATGPNYEFRDVLVLVPHWATAMFFAVWPLTWLVVAGRRRALRRVSAGTCATCGYDLRATPERCPECGTAVVAAAGPARAGGEG